MHPANSADEKFEHCEVRLASDTPPHVHIVDAPAVSMFSEKMQAGLSFLDDVTALHATDVYTKNSPLAPLRTKNPQEVWGDLSAWNGTCG